MIGFCGSLSMLAVDAVVIGLGCIVPLFILLDIVITNLFGYIDTFDG